MIVSDVTGVDVEEALRIPSVIVLASPDWAIADPSTQSFVATGRGADEDVDLDVGGVADRVGVAPGQRRGVGDDGAVGERCLDRQAHADVDLP